MAIWDFDYSSVSSITKLLEEKTGMKPVFRDERFTTVIASQFLRETGVSGKNKKKVVDQVAAEIILQEYLDIHRS